MRSLLQRLALTALVATTVMAASAARAGGLRVVATDLRGVTLQLGTGAWTLSPPDETGRVHVIGVPESHVTTDPGHGLVPVFSALLAVPPDAHPSVRVLSAEPATLREGVRLALAGKPVFRPDGHGSYDPGIDDVPPVLDGAWPVGNVLVGATASFRGRRLAAVEVRPFQYDESAGTLRATPAMVVRLDFNRPAGAAALPATGESDPHIDDVLRTTVLNFGQAGAWRLAPAGRTADALPGRPGAARTAATAFDEGQVEVRVQIDSTGPWLLPYDQLAAKGFPPGTPIAQVSVHRHEFLENATPAYGTFELPIDVEDANANGTFDSGDRIWLYARDWASRSGASRYQRQWGDAEVVYATVKPAGGLRMARRDGWRGATGLTPLPSYPLFTHWERDAAPIMQFAWSPTDTSMDFTHWTDFTLYYDRPDSIVFGVNDIDTTHAVGFATNWVARTPYFRVMWSAIKNPLGQATTVADSAFWSAQMPFTVSNTLNGSALGNGNNRFFSWGKNGIGPPDPATNYIANAGLDWFETTYWRRFNAVHDVLSFNSADAGGVFQLHATGFLADSVRIFDVTDPETPVRVYLDESHFVRGSTVAFDLQDDATAGRRTYVAVTVQAPRDPAFGPHVPPDDHFRPVTRYALTANAAGDYVMVVPEAFMAAAQPLAAFRQAQGLRVVVAPAEGVYDEFNGGRHSAAAIQRFAAWAYQRWGTQFLLLAGDGTLDPMNVGHRAGTDWIPVLPTPAPVPVQQGYELTASDNRYGCLTGNCDPITQTGGPPNDKAVLPELMIGRLPANSAADLTAMVDKLIRYEDVSGDQSWRRHVLLLADDAFSGEVDLGGGALSGYCERPQERRFVRLDRKVASLIQGPAGGLAQTNVELFNLRDYLLNEPYVYTAPDTCRPNRLQTRSRTHAGVTPVLMSHLNSGTLWWNYQGHANEYVLTHEDLYINLGDGAGGDDKYLFANTNQPVLFSAFSCHANNFARPEGGPGGTFGGCLGEDMVTLPQRGAIASWASTSFEEVPLDDSLHINVELARSIFADPPRDAFLSDHGSRLVLGEAILAAFQNYVPFMNSNQFERGVAITYTLLGDPATRMSVGRPQSLVFANDTAVVDQQPVRLHSPGDTLTLVANLVSTARLDTVGLFVNTGSGDIAIPAAQYTLYPAFPDTAGGGVYGGRRFRLQHHTQLLPQSYTYHVRTRDRDGLQTDFTVAFQLAATLRVDAVPIRDGDDVSPTANLSASLVCPVPIDPTVDVVLTINGVVQAFTKAPAAGDASGREWILSWTHPAYAKDAYVVHISIRGGPPIVHTFSVSTATGDLKLANLYAFPNPFDNDGTAFSFQLLGSDPADVKISVITISGRIVQSLVVRALAPGYHQIPWSGADAEGSSLSNGVYFYRLSAVTASGRRAEQLGRLVKLRKPRHVDTATP